MRTRGRDECVAEEPEDAPAHSLAPRRRRRSRASGRRGGRGSACGHCAAVMIDRRSGRVTRPAQLAATRTRKSEISGATQCRIDAAEREVERLRLTACFADNPSTIFTWVHDEDRRSRDRAGFEARLLTEPSSTRTKASSTERYAPAGPKLRHHGSTSRGNLRRLARAAACPADCEVTLVCHFAVSRIAPNNWTAVGSVDNGLGSTSSS
jgi:hypothetical protein